MGGIASARAARLSFIALAAFVPACRGASTAHSEPRPVASPGESARADCSSEEDAAAMHWSGTGTAIEVRARNGAVHAKPAKDDTIDIVAHWRGSPDRPREEAARLRVVHRGGVLVACVVAGGDEDDDDDDDACDGGGSEGLEDGALEIEVRVPKNVKFAGWTANGAVETEHLEGDVEAHAQNGSITLDTSGVARASTVNGSIVAKIGAKRWEGTLALETVNGAVRVDLPEGAAARLSAETVHGHIAVGVKLDGARVEDTRVEGRIGDGGGRLRLRSVNGGIEVY